MVTYARQGGTCSIFINDDGMQLISPELRQERMRFYENRNVGWVARPGHGKDGYYRAGRFKVRKPCIIRLLALMTLHRKRAT